ncbi:hypothetical protein [Actinomadura luteofluorescens]|uniref:hypothetical protein n=1 Tax=Actinomadura luteofluorescens TaxID=46163 RepID=UPI003D8AEE5B
MNTYIALINPGDKVAAGDTVGDGDVEFFAVTNPRMLPFGDETEPPTLAEIVTGTSLAKLVTVTPLTAPEEVEDGAATWFEAESWRVDGDASWEAVFGLQGAEVIAATKLVDEHLHGEFEYGGPNAADRYYPLTEVTSDPMSQAENCALNALEKAGADCYWWSTYAYGCSYGQELVAIAARDLIGTVPGWTAEAHDVLTAPYRAAFGDSAPGAKALSNAT